MITHILFDLGGILLPENWSELSQEMSSYLSQPLGIQQENLEAFFAEHREDLLSGDWSLRKLYQEMGNKYNALSSFSAKNAVEKHIEIYARVCTETDQQIIDLITELRRNGKTVVAVTNTEVEIGEYNKQRKLFAPFERAFLSPEVRWSKTQPGFYRAVLEELAVQPEHAVFIDNEQKYIDAAKEAYPQLHTILYGKYKDGFNGLMRELEKLNIT